MSADEKRPVVSGLLALVGVAVAVGLVTRPGGRLAGAHVLGLGGGHAAVAGDAGATMYLPKPQKTKACRRALDHARLQPDLDRARLRRRPTIHKPKKRISLQAGETSVAPMGRIDLTGTYPGGEGAVLNVQKFSNGSWQDFYSISAIGHQRHVLDLHPDRDARASTGSG